MFALKVQTNILFDYFQTVMEDTKMLASASTARTNSKQEDQKYTLQTDTQTAHVYLEFLLPFRS